MSFWHTLGIAPTADKVKIRHAYAEKTKMCHPEEDPQGFDTLHKAFLAAMQYARRSGRASQTMQPLPPEVEPVKLDIVPEHGRYNERKKARQPLHRQRAKLIWEQRRLAEQQLLEDYAKEMFCQQEQEIALGMGRQEQGQQFDFTGIDAPTEEAEAKAFAEPQYTNAPNYEQQAWQNTPDGDDWV